MKTIRQFFSPPPIDTEQLRIIGLGIQEPMRPGIVNRPAGTGDYLFMFFYDEVIIEVDGENRHCPPNTLIIWDPRHGHYYGNPDASWLHSWTHCDGMAIREMVEEENIPLQTPLTLPDPAVVEKYLLDIYREVTGHAVPDPVIVRHALHSWLREVRRALGGGEPGQVIPPRFLEIKHYLGAHFPEPITLPELAARAHLSVPHFCSEFKRYFGLPAIDYLIQLRLQHAAYLLRDHHLSITEIARLVGYHDLYHFSKQFKKHYHRCPRAMRQGLGDPTQSSS
ncbi:MAG: helix-turn-helix transcriptional regulator [Armatimonadota bacterium]